MKKLLNGIWLLALLSLLSIEASATHNRAGEITYEHVSGFTYRVIITTYTKESALADRPWLKLKWGDEAPNTPDNELDSLQRDEIDPSIAFDVQRNTYTGLHTYSGPGAFTIVVEDPNRNDGVNNIIASVDQIFCISSMIIISPLTGQNNSAVLLNDPIQDACIYQPWIYNPAAYDPDGDLLLYSLVPCMGDDCIPLLGWDSPELWTSETTDTFTIDPETGTITWDTPLYSGEYNIAIKIEEYRGGFLVGSIIRDMQITVVTCNNQPPNINPLPDFCIEAGEYFEFQAIATDPDDDNLIMEAFGGPLSNVVHPATFQPNIRKFTWTPQCEEVREAAYTLTLQVTDDGYIPLSNVETVNITVVAPRVENPTATAQGSSISLNWDVHECSDIFTPYQASEIRYKIYRRNNTFGFNPSDCELGVPEYTGYTQVGETQGINSTTFVDTNLQFGSVYCYMVVTCWFDGAISYASEEFCDTLRKDVPIMTKASVDFTDPVNGQMSVCWSPPHDLDTLVFPGPFYYELYTSPGFTEPSTLIYTSSVSPFLIWGDTCFVHENVNTQDIGHSYHVKLIANNVDTGTSRKATSVFLQTAPADNSVILQMPHDVPWTNVTYEIYRRDPDATDFVLVGTSNTSTYTDTALVNNLEYCYKVRTVGSFFVDLITDPIINWSQETCETPYDLNPPCPPVLTVDDDCINITNELVWNNPNNGCADDVTAYNVYYAPNANEELQLITTNNDPNDTTFIFPVEEYNFSIAGCYAITALDSLNLWPDGSLNRNESDFSEIICIDNCPEYFLPNIFSPNNDGINDFFVPFPYRYVESIDLIIFNRWGMEVFKTTDPDINWDGKNFESGNISPDGAYYYTIKVNTKRLNGTETLQFSGTIQLQDGKQPLSSE